jgi:hypothetical protein
MWSSFPLIDGCQNGVTVGTGFGVVAGGTVGGGVLRAGVEVAGGNVCTGRAVGAAVGAPEVTPPALQFGGHCGALSGFEHVHFATMCPATGSRHTGVPAARTDWNENGHCAPQP